MLFVAFARRLPYLSDSHVATLWVADPRQPPVASCAAARWPRPARPECAESRLVLRGSWRSSCRSRRPRANGAPSSRICRAWLESNRSGSNRSRCYGPFSYILRWVGDALRALISRTRSPASADTTKSTRSARDIPIRTKRPGCSVSGAAIPRPSRNAVIASLKVTPCLRSFAAALFSSHRSRLRPRLASARGPSYLIGELLGQLGCAADHAVRRLIPNHPSGKTFWIFT